MRRPIALILLAGLTGSAAFLADSDKKIYPYRWVRLNVGLSKDSDLEQVRRIATTASEHGLNGILLSAGLDQLDLKPAEYRKRLAEVKRICENHKLDIVPAIFSTGYGGSLLAQDRNLAEGLPVKDALFVVQGQEARLAADPPVVLANGGFEEAAADRLNGFDLSGAFNQLGALDAAVKKAGRTSLRLHNFQSQPEGTIRFSQWVTVHPYRSYRLSCWVKAESLQSVDPFGEGFFQLEVFGGDEKRKLQWENPRPAPGAEWREVAVGFNSWGYDKVLIAPSVTGGANGKFWIDDLKLEEVALVNVLRRPGTPLQVRSEESGAAYEEGRDFAPVTDPLRNSRYDHPGPPIRLVSGTRIRDGERLRVSFYHPVTIYNGQTPVCMSEPKVYEIWKAQARLIHEALGPKHYFLNADEQRAAGTCKACTDRGLTLGQIMGDCITRAFSLIRDVNPKAEIAVWSDMLDPNHNADQRKYYYLTSGNFYGSWNYVPKELIIGCWYYERRDLSLKHFSSLGFRTIAGSYYDADDLKNPRDWLTSMDATPGAVGIIYTTWLDKYALLGDFGDLVSKRK
ncbi:MAG: hypothetical protein EHM18_04790 [Acidobacteria bacterium]|nr:MAG: hypothetical protein EHM18_04790 [Acidobacteriota bacterium]